MNLEDFMLNEIRQLQMDIIWFPSYEIVLSTSFIKAESRNMTAKGWQRGNGELHLMGTVSVCDMKKVLWIDCSENCTAVWMYLMPQNSTLKMVKMVNFMLCTF